MAQYKVRFEGEGVKKRLDAIKKALQPRDIDSMVRKVALITQARVKRNTPKRWTGNTRNAWKVVHWSTGIYALENVSPVMKFLEHGTKPHGAKGFRMTASGKLVRKKLFIPLNRETALAYSGGTFSPSAKVITKRTLNRGGIRRKLYKYGKNKKFKYGTDYVLAKRVRGIKPRRIVFHARVFAKTTLKMQQRIYLRNALRTS